VKHKDTMPYQLLTSGQIARKLNVPLHRVTYFLRTRGIKPRAKAGPYYVYDDAAMKKIKEYFGIGEYDS